MTTTSAPAVDTTALALARIADLGCHVAGLERAPNGWRMALALRSYPYTVEWFYACDLGELLRAGEAWAVERAREEGAP
jgi:hypothetical protein